MDTPLLALTRRRRSPTLPGPAPGSAPDAIATDNMRQLIQLRWLAVIGQFVTVTTVRFGLGVPLPVTALLGLVAVLALANFIGALSLRRRRVTDAEFLLALLFDVGMLTAQLYLSGGADNPFIALYLVQVVLGAILLRTASIWVLLVVTTACYALLTIQHRPLAFPAGFADDTASLFMLGHWISYALVSMLLVLFIARISRNLRARDAYVADMRQHAAEEDNIVRMGLFASGAAHELGTPLASLSVILSDWQRMPKLATDPELIGELREMQSEVQRCKSIVTDILHSAGEPRSEALGGVDARSFVEELARDWRAARPSARLESRSDAVAGVRVLTDPALRQAVWSLLDNAGDVSPEQIRLDATQESGMLVLSVRDRGPGFSPAMLQNVGQPHRSSKGAGHGVGLFLVVTVARRLGGRVEIANLAGGGADVRLLVPLAHMPATEA